MTRLVVDDALTVPIRTRILAKFGEVHWLTYLVHCTWCTGMWVSVVLVGVTFLTEHPVWMAALTILAIAQVAPMVLAFSDRMVSGGD